MSPVAVDIPIHRDHARPAVRVVDDGRGTFGMVLFITTEATLFLMLFVAYYYTHTSGRWEHEQPPKLHYAIVMLIVLLTSSGVLHWGEKKVKQARRAAGRFALLGTILLGLGFLVLTFFEFRETLQHVTPTTDAYGSTFFTLVSLHAAHVVVGLSMLIWVLILPQWEPTRETPHRPYHNAAMYWHFVDTVWVFLVALLYIVPNIYNAV